MAVVGFRDEDIASSIHRYASHTIQAAGHGGLAAGVGAAGRNFDHPAVVCIRDKDIASSIHRHTVRNAQTAAYRGLRAAARRNFHHLAVGGIGDEDIACCILRYGNQGAGRYAGHRGLRARAEGDRRSQANAVDRNIRQQVAAVVEDLRRTDSQSGRERGEGDVHCAGTDTTPGTAGAAVSELEIETGCALRYYLRRAEGCARRDVVGQRESTAARRRTGLSQGANVDVAEITCGNEGPVFDVLVVVSVAITRREPDPGGAVVGQANRGQVKHHAARKQVAAIQDHVEAGLGTRRAAAGCLCSTGLQRVCNRYRVGRAVRESAA